MIPRVDKWRRKKAKKAKRDRVFHLHCHKHENEELARIMKQAVAVVAMSFTRHGSFRDLLPLYDGFILDQFGVMHNGEVCKSKIPPR